MSTGGDAADLPLTQDAGQDVWADPAAERVATPATVVTGVRTVLAVALAGWAAHQQDLTLLVGRTIMRPLGRRQEWWRPPKDDYDFAADV